MEGSTGQLERGEIWKGRRKGDKSFLGRRSVLGEADQVETSKGKVNKGCKRERQRENEKGAWKKVGMRYRNEQGGG